MRAWAAAALMLMYSVQSLEPPAEAALLKAGELLQKAKWKKSIKQFRLALELKPDFNDAIQFQVHNNLGWALQNLKQPHDAIPHYRKSIAFMKAATPVATPYINLASLLKDEGKIDESLHFYRLGLEVDPDQTRSYCLAGLMLRDAGRHDEALEMFSTGLERADPEHHELHNYMGQIYALRRQYANASRHFALQYKYSLPPAPDHSCSAKRWHVMERWREAPGVRVEPFKAPGLPANSGFADDEYTYTEPLFGRAFKPKYYKLVAIEGVSN
jgi:tetratricopeptide (TPR) repeat protein